MLAFMALETLGETLFVVSIRPVICFFLCEGFRILCDLWRKNQTISLQVEEQIALFLEVFQLSQLRDASLEVSSQPYDKCYVII